MHLRFYYTSNDVKNVVFSSKLTDKSEVTTYHWAYGKLTQHGWRREQPVCVSEVPEDDSFVKKAYWVSNRFLLFFLNCVLCIYTFCNRPIRFYVLIFTLYSIVCLQTNFIKSIKKEKQRMEIQFNRVSSLRLCSICILWFDMVLKQDYVYVQVERMHNTGTGTSGYRTYRWRRRVTAGQTDIVTLKDLSLHTNLFVYYCSLSQKLSLLHISLVKMNLLSDRNIWYLLYLNTMFCINKHRTLFSI